MQSQESSEARASPSSGASGKSRNTTVAQISFTNRRCELNGVLVGLDENQISVELSDDANRLARIETGEPARVVMLARSSLYSALGHAHDMQGQLLSMRLDERLKKLSRRSAPRFACNIDVTIRAVQGGGCNGVWHPGICRNISYGGMAVEVRSMTQLPRRVEVRFTVPNREYLEQAAERERTRGAGLIDPLPLDSKSIRAWGSVVHVRQDPSGAALFGVCLDTMNAEDRARLFGATAPAQDTLGS